MTTYPRLTVLALATVSGIALLATAAQTTPALTASRFSLQTAAAAPGSPVGSSPRVHPAPQATRTPTNTASRRVLRTAATPGTSNPALASGLPSSVTCTGNPSVDTAALQSALYAGGTVIIAAGTCALDAKLPINKATTISGAGPTATFLIQTAPRTGIFNVKVQHVTIANINLNTAAANPVSYGSSGGTYAPGVIFSAQSYTSVINVTAEVGDGFGIRVTGSNPCANYSTVGTVIQNLNVTNTGSGGRAALDIDCTNGATISGITIHGQYLALYIDENVTVNGETYTSDPWMSGGTCHEPIYVTGPAANVAMTNITGGGAIVETTPPLTNVTQTTITKAPGC